MADSVFRNLVCSGDDALDLGESAAWMESQLLGGLADVVCYLKLAGPLFVGGRVYVNDPRNPQPYIRRSPSEPWGGDMAGP